MNYHGIARAYEELEHVSQDEIMRELAFKREKFLFEQAMRIDAAKDEANEKTARNALAMNLDVEAVAKITGLSIDEIKVLKENMPQA